ncbi:1,2-phenylacetyl-CoA epoxidase subunit PaaE [Aliikangiella coralliicola]|uniref:Phenylacetate-CoA oxygenase/reductase subunit PaaK n=1 Tax=Aliikangiella coralliicola TaxID=2592383 RepID=A0A545TSR3_9GAMM|nr:1,2-phenylacetyl-CoA epoxidase subunit PaaE [Aliikangiella coralliicola]TQV80259.1 phenylacetate-CoA oxygenase/reductase subunit PaaK [Aliikangiella coralliicola]
MSTEFHQLTIQSVEKLTKDAVAVSLEVPQSLTEEYRYVQGQHLTLKLDIDGQDIRRSYSICNSVQEQNLTVGIKRIEEGIFSNFANESLKKGMAIEVMAPQGHFYTELSAENKKNYLMVAVGSGITPMLSHIQSILEAEPESFVTLIYGNQSTPMMMFRDKLCFIKNAYMARFQWINLFTREENEAELFNGRINGERISALDKAKVININSFDDVFLCGPEEMITDVAEYLKQNEFSDEQVHYELFFAGSAEEKAKKSQAKRAQKYGEKTSTVSVKVAGRKTVMELSMIGENILDAAMEHGADLPFSCKGGVCATCKAKVLKGKVEMDLNHSLTPQEVEEGMILTCQSHPVSENVEIDFDLA